jgi:hypothetical protein
LFFPADGVVVCWITDKTFETPRRGSFLFLWYDMSVVMALNKGRAKDYRLLRITRRVSAPVVACGFSAQ